MAKRRAYLDIETTGLSPYASDLTVIGIGLEHYGDINVFQLFEEELSAERILEILSGTDQLYTYNGSRFDLPFIAEKLKVDLGRHFSHRDLMYDCWKHELKGGLKAVERKLGIGRSLNDIDGYVAVQLWRRYDDTGDETALQILLEYIREDVTNLTKLRRKLRVR
jgi:uncharacterized protein YprB with RNaseH-like and TPR domain